MPIAKDIMTQNLITVKKDLPIKELSKIFIEHKINGIPVVDNNGKLIGIVTEEDLIDQNKNLHIPTVISLFDAVIYLESDKKFTDDVRKLTGTTVADIYTSKVITITPETTLNDCANLMAEKNIHSLPVLENGALVGIVGKIDLIRGLAQE